MKPHFKFSNPNWKSDLEIGENMKKLFNAMTFGTNNKASAIFALLALFMVVLGCSAEKPAAPPTETEAQTLVKATMSEFAEAIDKNDFTAFKANTSKEFQAQYTEEQMKATFKPFVDQKTLIVPILRDAAQKNAQFSPAISVREEKGFSILVANGTLNSDPQPVKIKNQYVYQDGKWKLLTVEVNLE